MSNVLCNQCKKEITSSTYVKCYNCNANYHFSTCSSLSESTYASMYGERKTKWRCHVCKPRIKSPNNMYTSVVFNEHNKQLRTDDEDSDASGSSKKYKETMCINSLNNKLCSVQSDVTELKSDLKDIKSSIDQVSTNVNNSNLQIKEEIQSALLNITNTISALVTQVSELKENDKQREKQINTMETRINNLEQQMIVKNIEIKNVTNKNISAYDVVKTIGNSLGVEIGEGDIEKSYRLKKQDDKIIIEFSSLSKKQQLMGKIERHRVDAKIINGGNNNNENNTEGSSAKNRYIYINDQLTFNNRKLLWLAKTKAKESNWKFVWVRNGNICARKTENSSFIIINNASDIELITSTV